MEIKTNEDLSRYTTIRIGGKAERMYIPSSEEELLKALSEEPDALILGGGSNLLISDEKTFPAVINMREFNKSITPLGGGRYLAGCSLRLQELIRTINRDGYGGIEYLYSVPGLVGGAVLMNAGRGRQYGQAISDHLVRVKVLRKGKVQWVSREEAGFSYRNSVFKGSGDILLEAEFEFPAQSPEESYRRRKERMELVKRVQDTSAPNFGTVFMEADPRIMKVVRLSGLHKGKAGFSRKTGNWILNRGGSYKDVRFLLSAVIRMHKALGRKCQPEIMIWD